MNPKILVTGFQPFLNEPINPSELLIKALASKTSGSPGGSDALGVGGVSSKIETLLLPVSYKNAVATLKSHWESAGGYRALLMLGQAAGRKAVCLERAALNWSETSYADEDGVRLPAGPLNAGAPQGLISDFFPNAWKEILCAEGPTEISFSAGTYVCNALYFEALHSVCGKAPALFVHVPYLPEQTVTKPEQPSLPLEVQKKIICRLIQLIDQEV